MRVKTAKNAGFCMGVKKAMDLVLNRARTWRLPIYTFGPLIHNPQVLDVLKNRRIEIAEDIEHVKRIRPSIVVIRTHGITPEERVELKKHAGEVVNCTCPRVARVQGIIKKSAHDGYTVVIIGDKKHAEVVALLAYAKGNGYVIDGPGTVKNIPEFSKICIVSQTTQSRGNFEKTVKAVQKRFPQAEIDVKNTLCDFTSRRQYEVNKLAEEVDALVVVGGKNSANTARLAVIAQKTGKPTYHIETESELDADVMKRYFTVGVTAGASTPNWVINRVVETLEDTIPFGEKRWKAFLNITSTFIIRSCLFLAVGAIALTYASSALQQIPFNIYFAMIPFFYVASMHIVNHYFDQDSMKYNEPSWYNFFQKYKVWLLNFGIISGILSLYFAFQISIAVMLLMVLGCITGGIYELNFFPKKIIEYSGLQNLKDLPASKDFSVSLAWSLIVTLVPLLGTPEAVPNWGTAVAFTFSFTLVFFRSILYDIKDIQGDALVSRETIPILIGVKKSEKILLILLIVQSCLFIGLAKVGLIVTLGYYLSICMLYCGICLYLFRRDILSRGNNMRLLVESMFILSGAMTVLWKFGTLFFI